MPEHHIEKSASAVVLAFVLAASGCAADTDADTPAKNQDESTYNVDDNAAADSDETAQDTPADALPPADDSKSDATYEVPVEDSLTSFAKYPVSHVKWEVKKGQRVLEYNLPDDLVGVSNKVKLVGPESADSWELTGDAGTASCSTEANQVRCHESLPGVTVDVAAIKTRVDLGQLAQEKLAVTKVFQGDPLGILQFTPR